MTQSSAIVGTNGLDTFSVKGDIKGTFHKPYHPWGWTDNMERAFSGKAPHS